MLEAGAARTVTKSAHVRMPSAHASGTDGGTALRVRIDAAHGRWCPPSSDSEHARAVGIDDDRWCGSTAGNDIDGHRSSVVRQSVEHRWRVDRASIGHRCGTDTVLANGKALRRRITRTTLARDARRPAMRGRCAMRASLSRWPPASSARSSPHCRRRCRARPPCASTPPHRATRSARPARTTALHCLPQSLVACGFAASMRVLPRVFAASSRGLAKVFVNVAASCARARRPARRRHVDGVAMRATRRVCRCVVAACDACLDSASRVSLHRCVRHRKARAFDGVIFWNFFLNITDQTNYDSP